MPPAINKQSNTARVRITEGCVVAMPGEEGKHVEKGAELELPLEEAFNVVSSGRGVLLDEVPSSLKTAQRK